MRKQQIPTALALIAGLAAALVRRWQMASAYEPGTDFMIPFAPATLVLWGITAVVLVGALAMGFRARSLGGKIWNGGLFEACRGYGDKSAALSVVGGVLLVVGAVMNYMRLRKYGTAGVPGLVFLLLAAAAGALCVLFAVGVRRRDAAVGIMPIEPSLLFVYWLAIHYKENAMEPQIMEYCFVSLAIAAAAVCFYYLVCLHYRRAGTVGTVAAHLIAVYFLALTVAEPIPMGQKLMLVGALVFILPLSLTVTERLTAQKIDEKCDSDE